MSRFLFFFACCWGLCFVGASLTVWPEDKVLVEIRLSGEAAGQADAKLGRPFGYTLMDDDAFFYPVTITDRGAWKTSYQRGYEAALEKP